MDNEKDSQSDTRFQSGDSASAPSAAEASRDVRRRFPLAVGVAIVLVLIAGVAAWLMKVDNAAVSGFEEADGGPAFPAMQTRVSEIHRIGIEGPEDTITLRKSDDGWVLAEKDSYPVPDDRVLEFLESVSSLRVLYVSKSDQPRYDEYGVSREGDRKLGVGTTISFFDQNGDVVTRATIGHSISVPGDSKRHAVIRRENEARIWMVDDTISIPATPLDWLNRKLLDIPKESVSKITITPPGNRQLAIERNKDNDLQIEKGLSAQDELKGPWVLDRMAEMFENLTFTDVRRADELDRRDTEPWDVELQASNRISYKARIFRTESGDWVTFSASAIENGVADNVDAFNSRHSRWAYKVPVQKASQFTTDAEAITK